MRGEGDVGLGDMVVMTGVPDITADAVMCVASRSMLGLDGSSGDGSHGETSRTDRPIPLL